MLKSVKYSVVAKSDKNTEIDYLFLKLKQANLVCGVVYKPPDVTFSKLDEFFTLLSEISSTEPNIMIMGDLNINLNASVSSKTLKFCDHLTALSFKLIATHPTCHKPDSSKANPENYWTREYHKIAPMSFISDLRNIDFNYVYQCTNVNDKLRCFNELLYSIVDKHAPLRKKTIINPNSPWINNQIDRLFRNRSEAYECWKRDKNNTQKWNNFKCLRNVANREVKRTKREFFASKLRCDLPARQLWKNIKRLGLKQANTTMGGGDVCADSLNTFFVSHNVPVSFNPNANLTEIEPHFSFRCVTSDEVLKEFTTASCDAVGNDNFPLSILKSSLCTTLPYITDIFNCIITTSEFPTDWKVAKVIPIGKIDNPLTEKDYRPISILCALSKIFESIISNQLNEYLTQQNLLCPLQSGYRKTCSTVTALIKIDNDIRESLDKKMITIMALLDFSKAFDTIDHRLLCAKLKQYFHLHHLSVKLIESYLEQRLQYVEFNNRKSDLISIFSGVPQGSILGPLLFSMYINDLPLVLSFCKFHLYADDCQLYISGALMDISDIVSNINSDIRNILQWCEQNGLTLNAKKTQTIVFRTKRTKLPNLPLVQVGEDKIVYSEVVKNLGLLMDSNLNWNAQVTSVCNKVYNALHSLVTLRHSTPQHTRIQLIRSLIVPLFDYGDILFGTISKKNLKKLNLVFNAATRYAFNLKKYEHISSYKNAILGCDFFSHLKLRMCLQTYKIINNPPQYLQHFFNFARSSRTSLLNVPRCSTNYLKESFRHRAIRYWNELPRSCRNERNFFSFKSEVTIFFSNEQNVHWS